MISLNSAVGLPKGLGHYQAKLLDPYEAAVTTDPSLGLARLSTAILKGIIGSAGKSERVGKGISGMGASANALAAMSGNPSIRRTCRTVSITALRGKLPR